MILSAIALGAVGVAYATGDAQKKQKMRQIGSQIAEVAKDTGGEIFLKSKEFLAKIKAKQVETVAE